MKLIRIAQPNMEQSVENFFSPCITLKRQRMGGKPIQGYWCVDLVKDIPIARQLIEEAGISRGIGTKISDNDLDAFEMAAGKHGYSVETLEDDVVDKTAQSLQFVKTPDPLDDGETNRAIRDAIVNEQLAIQQYEAVADATDDEDVQKVLRDIANEEKVHVGELTELLKKSDPAEEKSLDNGAKEVASVGTEKTAGTAGCEFCDADGDNFTCCQERGPKGSWCSRPKGHDGDHATCDHFNRKHCIDRWGRSPDDIARMHQTAKSLWQMPRFADQVFGKPSDLSDLQVSVSHKTRKVADAFSNTILKVPFFTSETDAREVAKITNQGFAHRSGGLPHVMVENFGNGFIIRPNWDFFLGDNSIAWKSMLLDSEAFDTTLVDYSQSAKQAKSLWQMSRFADQVFGEPSTWTYHINLDERGSFYADVRNPSGKTMHEIKAGNELREGESSIFDDGYMKHKHDMAGLKSYLVEIGIMSAKTRLIDDATKKTASQNDQELVFCDACKRPSLKTWVQQNGSCAHCCGEMCLCKNCGKPTSSTGTKLCDACWEAGANDGRGKRLAQSNGLKDCQRCKGKGGYYAKLRNPGSGDATEHFVTCDMPGCRNGKYDPSTLCPDCHDASGRELPIGGKPKTAQTVRPPTDKQLDYCYMILERVGEAPADDHGQPLFETSFEEADKYIKQHRGEKWTHDSETSQGDWGGEPSRFANALLGLGKTAQHDNVSTTDEKPKRCDRCGRPITNDRDYCIPCERRMDNGPVARALWRQKHPKPSKEAKILPDDGIADGGERYTDDELALMDAQDKAAVKTADKPRKWHIKVDFDDGDWLETTINGTQEEVRDYYLNNDFTLSDESSSHRGVKVEFIADLGDVPWTYYGESARPESAKQPEPPTPWPKSLWDIKK